MKSPLPFIGILLVVIVASIIGYIAITKPQSILALMERWRKHLMRAIPELANKKDREVLDYTDRRVKTAIFLIRLGGIISFLGVSLLLLMTFFAVIQGNY